MTKEDKDTKKKVTEGKKTAKAAEKKAAENKATKDANKMLLDMAASLPAGGANVLLKSDQELNKIEAEEAKLRLAKKAIHANLKNNKIEIGIYKEVRKMKKKAPEERAAIHATTAVYTQQMGIELTEAQKKQVELIDEKRKKARADMEEISGASSGREVGSATVGPKEPEDDEEEVDGVPAINEGLSATTVASNSTH